MLVKRDLPPRTIIPAPSISPPPLLPPPRPASPPKIILNHPSSHLQHDENCAEETRAPSLGINNNNHIRIRSAIAINGKSEKYESQQPIDEQQEEEDEEDVSNLPIIPEMLKNQIKIEPISEDEDEEDEESHIIVTSANNSYNQDAPQYNSNNNTIINNQNHPSSVMNSPKNQVSSDGGDPNQQLLVLSNPRIGDGPGEYLCNVCQAKFVYKNNLKSHLKRHLGIYP